MNLSSGLVFLVRRYWLAYDHDTTTKGTGQVAGAFGVNANVFHSASGILLGTWIVTFGKILLNSYLGHVSVSECSI